MGKKRHTAKTGDKALYKSRDSKNEATDKRDADDDPMFDEVDRYNNARDELQKDMLHFGNDKNDDSSVDDAPNEENVFDLGVGGSSSESEDDDEDDSESADETTDHTAAQTVLSDSSVDEDGSSSSDNEFQDQAAETDILNWGKSKRDYYNGDTADLEIGQEIEDAELEEDAGKEVLRARMEGLSEDDFIFDTDEPNTENNESAKETKDKTDDEQLTSVGVTSQSKKRRNHAGLSKFDKIKLMKRTHPELLPLVSHFRDEMIRPCAKETLVVNNALFQNEGNIEAIGATPAGLQYLLSKAMLQTSAALNVCQYLLLKAEYTKEALVTNARDDEDMLFESHDEDRICNHPVIGCLHQLNVLSEKLQSDVESNVKGLKPQMETLTIVSNMVVKNAIEKDNNVASKTDGESCDAEESVNATNEECEQIQDDQSTTASLAAPTSDEDEDIISNDRDLMTEARFSVRPDDDEDENIQKDSTPRNNRRRALPSFSGFGDADNADNQQNAAAAGRSLASTMNSISQRSRSKKSQGRNAPEVEDNASDDERTMRALQMMEEDVGGDDHAEDNPISDNEFHDSLDEKVDDDFYSKIEKKSKQKKEYKNNMYSVSPKYPVIEEEVDAERSVGNMIMKNRGLVAHKAKINRNPRVKKREQYRKALIRRKGQVREVRTDEGHKYGGESTGIKSHLSRSRKL